MAVGSGTRLILASTTIPSVPSEPTMSFARLNGSTVLDELVQVVAADPAKHLRIPAFDLARALAGKPSHFPIAGGFKRLAGADRVEL